MKVAKKWLKELVKLPASFEELERLMPLRTIAITESTPEYFELDMKGYNRADLLSLRGVALEVAAITNSHVTFKDIGNTEYEWVEKGVPKLEVKVEDLDLIPVYCLAKVEGLKVDKSSEDWIKKLADSGMRSVNNIADVTNLVMLEYGQPLHSFDAETIDQKKIIVRTAKKDETLVTLDEKKRALISSDIVITDPTKVVGLAGVMGGKNSEVSDGTHSILLEAAIFDPVTIRKTATRLNLNSEASKRFQHGLTKKRLLEALNAAILMYQQLGGTLTGLTLVGDFEDQKVIIPLSLEQTNNLIGVEITEQFVEDSLKKLNFTLADKINQDSQISWVVCPPFYRLDVSIAEDVIEEVARMYGYEKIEAKPLVGELPAKVDQTFFTLINSTRQSLAQSGITEVQTYSFYSTEVLNNLEKEKSNLLKLTNPMSAETEYLRDALWPNLLEVSAFNLKYLEEVVAFELGKVYKREGSEVKEQNLLSSSPGDKL
jgi:phenylalanyl-tRNA synthetase beta chain